MKNTGTAPTAESQLKFLERIQTRDGRHLRVIYVPDAVDGSIFVITAYDLGPKARLALRRRLRKKR